MTKEGNTFMGNASGQRTPPTERGEAWQKDAVLTADSTRAGQMAKIFGYVKGLHAIHLMDLGRQLGLFAKIASNSSGIRPEMLATELQLYTPYVRQWCETACALELLDYDPTTGYRFAPFMDEILGSPDATYYLGGFPPVHLLVERDYARFPELFQTGGTYPYAEHDELFLQSIPLATATIPRMFLDGVLPKLPDLQARLLSGARILDVGCGAGDAIVELATRFPGVRCVGLDVDDVSIRLAQRLVDERGLNDRVELHAVHGTEWPEHLAGSFDLVTTFLVLHEIRPDLKDSVLDRCAWALRPGGQLLLFDERYPSRPAELRDPVAIFGVMAQWYELVWGNEIEARDEILARLERQRLRLVDETALSRFYIVMAERSS
jgi:SAM-dependent methyltransferase